MNRDAIKIYDIVRVDLDRIRCIRLEEGGDMCRKLIESNGCMMRVDNIRHAQEPEMLRTFVLSYKDYDDYAPVLASRDDFVFIMHGSGPQTAPQSGKMPTAEREQLDLFDMEAE